MRGTATLAEGLQTPLKGPLRRRMGSLSFKASLLVVLLVVTVSTIGTVLTSHAMEMVLLRTEHDRVVQWAQALAASSADAVEWKDEESLVNTVHELTQFQGMTHIAFADPSGNVLASGGRIPGLLGGALSQDGRHLSLEATHTPRFGWLAEHKVAFADVLVPIQKTDPATGDNWHTRPIVGYLRLGADVTDAKSQLEEVARRISWIGMALTLFAVPFCLLVTRHVAKPINTLARTARAIANGSTDARADIKSENEIGQLADSFNIMADRLTSSRLELLELNAALEQRVQERTRELQDLASRDPLTNLYNRRHFSEVMAREFASAERYDADLTCLMFDLDHFKEINDLFGHRAGDDVLISFAEAVRSELRESDVAARFGGDEFILLLPQTSGMVASNLVDRVCERFGQLVTARVPDAPAEVSIGVASLRITQAQSAEALIHEADVALYAAKEGGRNCVVQADRTSPEHN